MAMCLILRTKKPKVEVCTITQLVFTVLDCQQGSIHRDLKPVNVLYHEAIVVLGSETREDVHWEFVFWREDLWVLRYEQLCDNMNPHVTEVMMNMGFEWNQMLNSLINKS
ncbi:hypothetical protein QTO34_017810 [Cnephaeus nilssonii]|uniref:Uncharacterized protein n=1 Tax=Cnephaeus nilssonii TaxID=3371016 RepID=A0AA40I1U4_CNENI|nr:hypothetical protein QTO34_017810 [Eptesicus nilssonii]